MRRRLASVVALLIVLLGAAGTRPAEAADDILVSGLLASEPIPTGAGSPSRLDTTRRTILELTVTNRGTRDVEVGTVVLRGRVLALTFFSYETSVAIPVPAASTVTRQFSLDLAGLKGQAVGLFNSDIRLLDQHRTAIAERRTAVDVRGSWRSVYGLFGLALAMATAAAFVRAVLDLARHRLSGNRSRRAIRFLVPGFALGSDTGVHVVGLADTAGWPPRVDSDGSCPLRTRLCDGLPHTHSRRGGGPHRTSPCRDGSTESQWRYRHIVNSELRSPAGAPRGEPVTETFRVRRWPAGHGVRPTDLPEAHLRR